ncbi:galectin-3-like [Atheta coriaria]|uniref:galectin-3-like n=1 Tax=Dalotia coriaria TaxID=877792 RepID=UPI0031F3A570
MSYLTLLVFAVLASLVYSQRMDQRMDDCEIIRVDKGDRFGTRGTCCVTWDDQIAGGRKGLLSGLFGGMGFGAGVSGYLNDSKGRNIKGGIGGTVGFGLGGGGDDDPPAPSVVPVPVAVPGPAAPPAYPPPAYPPAYPAPYPHPGYY